LTFAGVRSDLQGLGALREAAGELLVDGVVDEEPVGAHARLAAVAEFRDHRPVDCGVQVGVLEDDEGRVAAQFQGHLLDGGCALGGQDPADLGGSGEGEVLHDRAGAQFPADGGRGLLVAGDDVEDPGR